LNQNAYHSIYELPLLSTARST